uniref:Alpha-1,4-N-acetylglucosaminyltransferase n=2 Tax=Trichogramma TaxID=7490 RepID=A0ABD2WQ84_9HYME
MVRQLQDPLNEGIFNHEKGHLSNQVLRDSDNCAHFVFWDEDFIRRVAPHLSILFVDCTYKTCIEIRGENMQLATIMGVFHDHALPLIWFIMSRKTLNAYSRIAATARGILHDSRVQAIVTDFEIGLRNAFRLHFPDAHLVGCMFHFARCLMRKIHQLRLTDYVNNDEAASETVRKIIALSFLPAEQIQENLHAITSSIPNEMFQNLHPFLHYFETFWMGRIGVDNFSLFGIHNRTNNAIESYHSVLLHKLGLHPPFWSWVCKIKTLQLHLWIDLTTMESGRQVARQQSNKTQFKNNVLQRCWRLLYLRHITAAQFLSITAKLIGGYFRRYSQDIPAMDVQAMIELERSFNNNLNLPVNPGGPDPEFDNSIMREFPAHEREWVRQAVLRRIGENNQPNEPVRENAGLVMRVRDERARRRRRRRRREPMINQAADVDARPEAEPAAIQNNLADNAVLGADEVNRPMNQAANVDARPEAVPAAIQNNLADNAALGADEVNRPMNQAADVDARPEAVPAAIQNNLVDNAVLGADEVNRPMNQAADVDARPEAVPAAIQNNLADNDVAHQEPADAVLDDDPMPIIEGKNIFFHETSCVTKSGTFNINCRQACAIESAAYSNAEMSVILLYINPFKLSNHSLNLISKLLKYYPNIQVRRILVEEYMKYTPIEKWFASGILQSSRWPNSHMSDILRYLTLWKFGGIYLDLDVVVTTSLVNLTNFAGAEDWMDVAAGVISFSENGLGRRIANGCLRDLMRNFRGDLWGNNGPGVITRTLQKFCSVKYAKDMTSKRCNGFKVFPPSVFYPIFYKDWRRYFQTEDFNATMKLINSARAIHLWNKLSFAEKVYHNSKVPYAIIAEKYCPHTFNECTPVF